MAVGQRSAVDVDDSLYPEVRRQLLIWASSWTHFIARSTVFSDEHRGFVVSVEFNDPAPDRDRFEVVINHD